MNLAGTLAKFRLNPDEADPEGPDLINANNEEVGKLTRKKKGKKKKKSDYEG